MMRKVSRQQQTKRLICQLFNQCDLQTKQVGQLQDQSNNAQIQIRTELLDTARQLYQQQDQNQLNQTQQTSLNQYGKVMVCLDHLCKQIDEQHGWINQTQHNLLSECNKVVVKLVRLDHKHDKLNQMACQMVQCVRSVLLAQIFQLHKLNQGLPAELLARLRQLDADKLVKLLDQLDQDRMLDELLKSLNQKLSKSDKLDELLKLLNQKLPQPDQGQQQKPLDQLDDELLKLLNQLSKSDQGQQQEPLDQLGDELLKLLNQLSKSDQCQQQKLLNQLQKNKLQVKEK